MEETFSLKESIQQEKLSDIRQMGLSIRSFHNLRKGERIPEALRDFAYLQNIEDNNETIWE